MTALAPHPLPWLLMNERPSAPRDGRIILACCVRSGEPFWVDCIAWDGDAWTPWDSAEPVPSAPTHWCAIILPDELPAAPELITAPARPVVAGEGREAVALHRAPPRYEPEVIDPG